MTTKREEMTLITIHHPEDNASFTEEEANQVTPLLLVITRKTKSDMTRIKGKMAAHRHNHIKAQQCQEEIRQIVRKWGDKVCRLGATPIGAWKVLIPSSEKKHFEWEFPSTKVFET